VSHLNCYGECNYDYAECQDAESHIFIVLLSIVILSVKFYCYAECYFAQYRYADCYILDCFAEYHYTESCFYCYAESRNAECLLSVIFCIFIVTLSVIRLNVTLVIVMAPPCELIDCLPIMIAAFSLTHPLDGITNPMY
jgi:hypothetical protein